MNHPAEFVQLVCHAGLDAIHFLLKVRVKVLGLAGVVGELFCKLVVRFFAVCPDRSENFGDIRSNRRELCIVGSGVGFVDTAGSVYIVDASGPNSVVGISKGRKGFTK
jgi:hypothetical protein